MHVNFEETVNTIMFNKHWSYSRDKKWRLNINFHGGGVMFLIHNEIPYMPLTELENVISVG